MNCPFCNKSMNEGTDDTYKCLVCPNCKWVYKMPDFQDMRGYVPNDDMSDDVQVREHSKCMVAELCIDVGGGQVVVTPNNTFEFHDCLPISIDDMKYVIEEAEAFVEYRDGRNSTRRHNH